MGILEQRGLEMRAELKELEELNSRIARLANSYRFRVRIVAQALGNQLPLFAAGAE